MFTSFLGSCLCDDRMVDVDVVLDLEIAVLPCTLLRQESHTALDHLHLSGVLIAGVIPQSVSGN